jgi:hypothetical protein
VKWWGESGGGAEERKTCAACQLSLAGATSPLKVRLWAGAGIMDGARLATNVRARNNAFMFPVPGDSSSFAPPANGGVLRNVFIGVFRTGAGRPWKRLSLCRGDAGPRFSKSNRSVLSQRIYGLAAAHCRCGVGFDQAQVAVFRKLPKCGFNICGRPFVSSAPDPILHRRYADKKRHCNGQHE